MGDKQMDILDYLSCHFILMIPAFFSFGIAGSKNFIERILHESKLLGGFWSEYTRKD